MLLVRWPVTSKWSLKVKALVHSTTQCSAGHVATWILFWIKKNLGEGIKCALHSTINFFLVTNIVCGHPKPASRPSFFFFQTSTYNVDKQKAQRGETHRASGRNSSRFRRLYHRCAVWFVWALWCYDTWEKEKIWRLVEVLVSSLVSGQFIDRLQAHVIARKCWILHNMGNVMFIPT